MSCDISRVLPSGFSGSTYLNSQIRSYGDLVYRTKTMLGFPNVPVELTDAQWKIIIDEALELYTQYVRGEEKILTFCLDNNYDRNCGIRMDYLINPCNSCVLTCSSVEVTGTACVDTLLDTSSGYFYSSPPTHYETVYFDDTKTENNLTSAIAYKQEYLIDYNRFEPWNTSNICDFDKICIRPYHSEPSEISNNPTLSALSGLSGLPLSSLPLSAFYEPLSSVTWPMEACMRVKDGIGNIRPCVDITVTCSSASDIYYRIDPSLSVILLDTAKRPYTGIDACREVTNNTLTSKYLSGGDGLIFNPYVIEIDNNKDGWDDNKLMEVGYISASDGSIFPPQHLRVNAFDYVQLLNFPHCAGSADNEIYLSQNNGWDVTFHTCNSALDTFGYISVPTVKFLSGNFPQRALFDTDCIEGWNNGGFRFQKTLSSNSDCLYHNKKVLVDLDFYKTVCEPATGIVTHNLDTQLDGDGFYRKVQGVFSLDAGTGANSENTLFSLDLAIASTLFGDRTMSYGMGGNRFDLTTYHLAKSYVQNIKKMFRPLTFQYNPRTQYLKIYPEPRNNDCGNCYMIGVYIEPALEEIISEEFVRNFTYGKALTVLGKIRGRYGNVALFGGATISGDAAINEGEKVLEKCLSELREQYKYDMPQTIYWY